jgi:predicted  nucleic acid-binding Zn-ribbon protein
MCKKLMIAVLAIVVGVGVVSGTRVGSHFRLWWNKSSTWAKNQVPPETEIERLRMELDRLSKLDDRYYDQVARQKLEVKKFRDKLSKEQAALVKLEGEIKAMRLALNDETEFVTYNGSRYARTAVEAQVREDAPKFLADEAGIKADEEHLKEMEKTLAINEGKLKDLDVVRKKMAARIRHLEKDLAQERRLQTQNQLTLDDSHYSTLTKQIDELEGRIENMKAKRELRGQSIRGSVRQAEEAKEEAKKLDQLTEQRFGKVPGKVADGR